MRKLLSVTLTKAYSYIPMILKIVVLTVRASGSTSSLIKRSKAAFRGVLIMGTYSADLTSVAPLHLLWTVLWALTLSH